MYLKNLEKSLIIKFAKKFLFDIKKKIYIEFIISLLRKSTKPKTLIYTKTYYAISLKLTHENLQIKKKNN